MTDLFNKDPVFTGRKRDSKGRYATAEKALYDKAIREHRYLQFQVEKFCRQAEASNGAFITLQRINENLKRTIADLRKELANLKRNKKQC